MAVAPSAHGKDEAFGNKHEMGIQKEHEDRKTGTRRDRQNESIGCTVGKEAPTAPQAWLPAFPRFPPVAGFPEAPSPLCYEIPIHLFWLMEAHSHLSLSNHSNVKEDAQGNPR